LVLPI
ncbi:hypothetical protein D030_0762B, partial [Vibrio parahaemolyticus AQ3810]